jgi:hypothetical protein
MPPRPTRIFPLRPAQRLPFLHIALWSGRDVHHHSELAAVVVVVGPSLCVLGAGYADEELDDADDKRE